MQMISPKARDLPAVLPVPPLVSFVMGRVLCGWLVMFPIHVVFSIWTILPLSFLVPTWVELLRV